MEPLGLGLVVEGGDAFGHRRALAPDDGQLSPGRVVAVLHAGGAGALALLKGAHDRLVHLGRAADFRDALRGHAAGAQHPGGIAGDVDHRGFQSHPAGAAVQDQGNAPLHVLPHVKGGGGAGASGAIGAGGGDGPLGGVDQRPGVRVGGKAHRHGVKARCDRHGHPVRFGKDQRHRPRPAGVHQGAGHGGGPGGDQRVELVDMADVHDQRIVAGAALGLEDAADRGRVQRVRAQAVYGFGGKGHQFA